MGKLLIIFSKIDTFNRFLTIRGVFNRIQRIYLKKGVAFSPTGKIHTTGFCVFNFSQIIFKKNEKK